MKKSDNRDAWELPAEVDFSKGVRGRFYRPKKVSTTLRLDNDLLLYFKKMAAEKKTGYQTLISEALREYLSHHAA